MPLNLSKSVSLLEIGISDYEELYMLMQRIYPRAYQYLWNDDCSWYIDHVYNQNQVAIDVKEEGSLFYFVIVNGKKEGILKLKINIPYPEQPTVTATKLDRIYLSEEIQGKGVSKVLMEFALEVSKENESEILWLDCMDSKHQALKYYVKYGFQKGGLSYLDFELLKDEYRGIYLMWKEIERERMTF